uniref:C-type lectin domain-containing protein n=1 Tax=Sinocyclocheilus anshuiensis TaxID=1608454 RepID=A0A671SI83_9TELE
FSLFTACKPDVLSILPVVQTFTREVCSAQICKRGTEKPCYKIAYFQDARRKLNFEDASRACRSDGGDLLGIESKTEQILIENFIHELKASDGDFWIGLRRDQGYEEINGDCPSQYYWLDGSRATFRETCYNFLKQLGS